MKKRGSRYLRYALFDTTKHICLRKPLFADYLAKNVLKVSVTTQHKCIKCYIAYLSAWNITDIAFMKRYFMY